MRLRLNYNNKKNKFNTLLYSNVLKVVGEWKLIMKNNQLLSRFSAFTDYEAGQDLTSRALIALSRANAR